MTIECYYATCPNHSVHTAPDDGPFCDLDECIATALHIKTYEVDRAKYLKEAKERYLVQISSDMNS